MVAAIVLVAACAPASHDAVRVTAVGRSSTAAPPTSSSSSPVPPAAARISTASSVVREDAPASSRPQRAHRGAVAANRWPLGTRLRVAPSPVGGIVTVEDRIGYGSELDFAMPGDCAAARAWGRRAVTVEVVR